MYNFPLILKSISPAIYTNQYRILHSVTRLTLALKFAIARLKTAVRYLFLILPPPLEEGFLTTHSSATPVSTSGALFNNTRAAAGCHK